MKLVELKYKKYSYPLKNPLKISNQSISKKDIIIIRAEDEAGNFHFGEVSPLPGFSHENIEEYELKLQELLLTLEPIEIDEFKKSLIQFINYPSLLFALEQLVISCQINRSDNLDREVKTNGLVGIDSCEKVLQKIREYADEGFESIKLKIGRPNFRDDLEIIEKIHNEFGSKFRLRLDNNGSWDLSQAERNVQLLSSFNIEYIEQPVNNTKDLLILAEKSPISLAADESVLSYDDAVNFINGGLIKYLVVKPSIRLGIFDTIKIIDLANKVGVNIIISSAFETAIGRSALLYLSSMIKNTTHGLNTELLGSRSIQTAIDYSSSQIQFNYSNLFLISVVDFL